MGLRRNWDRVATSPSHVPVGQRRSLVEAVSDVVTLASLSPAGTEESVRQVEVAALHEKRPGGRPPHGNLIRLGVCRPRMSTSARVIARSGLQNLGSRPRPIAMCGRRIQDIAHMTFGLIVRLPHRVYMCGASCLGVSEMTRREHGAFNI